MRVKVIGECNSAKAVRGYLRMAGVCVTDFLPPDAANFVLQFEEGTQEMIICDSVPCELEKHVLEILHEFLSKLPHRPDVQLRRAGGQVRGDREILLIVPAGDPLQQHSAEKAAYLGLLRTTNFGNAPALPAARDELPKKSFVQRLKGMLPLAILLLAAGALRAAPPPVEYNVAIDQAMRALMLNPPILMQVQFPRLKIDVSGNLLVNCAAGCGSSGGTSSSFGAAFPATGTAIGVKNGANMVNLAADGSSNLLVNCAVGCGSSSFADNSAFTAGTTPISLIGGWYSTVPTNCTSGNGCAPQLTIDRKLFVQAFQGTSPWVVSASGNFPVTQVTSPWVVSLASTTITGTVGVTQSTTPWVVNTTQWASGTLGAMANYGTSPGAVLVPGVNSFITNTPAVSQSGNWTARIVGNGGAVLDAAGQNAAAPASWLGIGCIFFTSPTALTTGNGTYLNCDTSSNILTRVNSWFGSTAPTVGSKTSANSIPVVIASDQGSIAVTLASTTITGTVTILGNKTNNNAAPGATNIGDLPALANAATQTWTEGDQVTESVDLSGRQRMRGTNGDNDVAATTDRVNVLPGAYQSSYNAGSAGTVGRNAQLNQGTDGLLWTASLPALRPASYHASASFVGSSTTFAAHLAGNASDTVVVTKVTFTCTQTTAGILTVTVNKTSAASTGGTAATMTAIPDDSAYSAASSVAQSFTGTGPTVGTPVGQIDAAKVGCMATGTATPNDIYILNLRQKPIVLRGTAQTLEIGVGAATTGGNYTVTWEWIETATITE